MTACGPLPTNARTAEYLQPAKADIENADQHHIRHHIAHDIRHVVPTFRGSFEIHQRRFKSEVQQCSIDDMAE
jgi:hypothetical protein